MELDEYNIEALKGVLKCNYKLGQFSEAWDLTNSLNFDFIKDPLVFLGFFQIGFACIEGLNEERSTMHSEESKQLEIKCESLLLFALENSDHSDFELLEQIANNFYEIHNYQSVK